jgi:hypothetical protein
MRLRSLAKGRSPLEPPGVPSHPVPHVPQACGPRGTVVCLRPARLIAEVYVWSLHQSHHCLLAAERVSVRGRRRAAG